jgi:hypothetical protein
VLHLFIGLGIGVGFSATVMVKLVYSGIWWHYNSFPTPYWKSNCIDVRKFCLSNILHTVARFVYLWQILSYHGLTRLKRFVLRSTSKWRN